MLILTFSHPTSVRPSEETGKGHDRLRESSGLERIVRPCGSGEHTGRRACRDGAQSSRWDDCVLSVYLGTDRTFVDDLNSKKRYAEAATVLLDYARDVRQAVIAYVEGNFFADARRIVSSATLH